MPNTAKNIFWRAYQNLLPTKDNLLKRKVVDEPYCPICKEEPETVLHALWGFPSATDVWGCSKVIYQKCGNIGDDFWLLAEFIFSRCGEEDTIRFIHLARQIWTRRNKWVHKGLFISLNTLLQETERYMSDYEAANEKEIHAGYVNNNNPEMKWTAPPRGMV